MKKVLFISSLILILVSSQLKAQDTQKTAKELDPLDISTQLEQIEKYGVPTIATVEEMKNNADNLYKSELWEDAITAYILYAQNVNWLANLLSQCIEPYYSASYDDRKNMSYSRLEKFIPFEDKANECKSNRNFAYVRIGLCYKNMGDVKNAVAYLHKALKLIDVKEVGYWNLAKDALAELIQFYPKK